MHDRFSRFPYTIPAVNKLSVIMDMVTFNTVPREEVYEWFITQQIWDWDFRYEDHTPEYKFVFAFAHEQDAIWFKLAWT